MGQSRLSLRESSGLIVAAGRKPSGVVLRYFRGAKGDSLSTRPGLRIVTTFAKRLPVTLQPEQAFASTMWANVVDYRGGDVFVVLLRTMAAVRVFG
jgi:hypothetical protein